MKVISFLFITLLAYLGLINEAAAVSVLDTTMTASITSGMTDIKDTVKDVLTISWPYILGIIALLASPNIVKHMINVAKGGK